MYNEKYRDGGGLTPYVAPNIKVEPNKEIVFDEIGNIKVIREKDKVKNDRKASFERYRKYIIAFLVFCVMMECYFYVRSYSPWKWKVEAFRPIIVNNMLKVSSPSRYQQEFFNEFINDGKTDTDMKNEENRQYIRNFKSQVSKKSLLYKTPDEIEEILGKPETDDSLNRANVSWQRSGFLSYEGDYEYEYTALYYAYTKKGYNYYVIVDYVCDISRAVSVVSFTKTDNAD